jgi:hypothetical protein
MSAEKQRSAKKKPVFLQAAEAFYGAAFDHRSRRELAQAMREWGRLDDSEQRFAVAHLLFLNLQAQGEVVRVLGAVRRTAEEIAEGVDQALDGAGDGSDPGDTPDGDLPDPIESGDPVEPLPALEGE